MSFYKILIRPLLFRMDPETAHHWVVGFLTQLNRFPRLCALARSCCVVADPALRITVCGMTFDNPIGLAAGFDKDACAVHAVAALGFGFVEVGTVVPQPQPGNPRPRMFRIPSAHALVNHLGFNSEGMAAAQRRLARIAVPPCPIGINLGKNKATPNETAFADYQSVLTALYPYGTYFVVNVSSPNTPTLRELQSPARLEPLLRGLLAEVEHRAAVCGVARKPLFVKLAPDLTDAEVDALARMLRQVGVDGIIATNTTIARPGVPTDFREEGGLSGPPLRQRSTEVIRRVYRATDGTLPIIGVGGIFSVDDAWEKITAGASLLQIYTGLIYEGPGLPRCLCAGIAARLRQHGLTSVQEAVGSAARYSD